MIEYNESPDDEDSDYNPPIFSNQQAGYHEAGHAVAAIAFVIQFDYAGVSGWIYRATPDSTLGRVVFKESFNVLKPDFDRNDPEGRQFANNFLLCIRSRIRLRSPEKESDCSGRKSFERRSRTIT
jgi:hypothetical protein